MSEIKELKTSAEVILGGVIKPIKKLRAGEFYKAQKIVTEMFREASKISGSSKSMQSGKPDMTNMDLGELVGLFETLPNQVAKFVAVCAEISEEELLKEAYPEEINEAFGVCLELNNVMENLKNSVAPIGKLGGKSK